jgi:hypothetical protein
VAGVVATLVSDNEVESIRQQVYEFAFAFIAPLRAQNYDIAHLLVGQTIPRAL